MITMEVAGKTERELFISFFKAMGVRHGSGSHNEDRYGAVSSVASAQATFKFDKSGRYLGVEWDDMGHFDEKISPT